MAWAQQDEQIQDDEEVTERQDKPWRKKSDEPDKKKKTVSRVNIFKMMARDLLGKPHWSERFWGLLDQEIPKIAIHPFQEDELPISLEEAQTYVDGFTRALIRETDGRYAVVGREELGAVVSDINEMGTRNDSINPLGDLIARARSDLLAVGSLNLQGDNVILAYKLVETETGRIVSASQRTFKRKQSEETKMTGGLSLQGAAQKAAARLLRDVVSVRKIMVQGVRYQTSGVHSTFGRYFMGLLSDNLRREASRGPRNINDLDVSDFVVEEEAFRGLQMVNGSVEENRLKQKGNDYILKGTYWVFDATVEIRLSLENSSGSSVAWRGKVVKSEIPSELELVPPAPPIDDGGQGALGPIDLYLSSNKGQNPLYRIGEKMTLVIRSRTDAFVSCYYLQADGAVFRIFPNRYIPSGKINGGFTQYIPSGSMPFSFEFTPPSGIEGVKCFALDRDMSSTVYRQTIKAAFEPLSLANERELTRIYRSLSDVAISEASLIVTVQD